MDNFIATPKYYGDSTWEMDCPYCGRLSHARSKLGPYSCPSCEPCWMISCDGWLDMQGGDNHAEEEARD